MKCTCSSEMGVITAYQQCATKVITIWGCESCGNKKKVSITMGESKNGAIINALEKINFPGGLIADIVSDLTNTMTYRGDNFADAMTDADEDIQSTFTDISLLWLRKLNDFNTQGYYDGRNEDSVKTAVKLWKILKDIPIEGNAMKEIDECTSSQSSVKGDWELDFRAGFVIYFSMEHRTLQQTFSGLVFDWIGKMPVNDVIKEKLKKFEEENPYFWKTPLI